MRTWEKSEMTCVLLPEVRLRNRKRQPIDYWTLSEQRSDIHVHDMVMQGRLVLVEVFGHSKTAHCINTLSNKQQHT